MADHDGHTVNVGPVTVGVDTDVIRARRTAIGKEATDRLCDEVDRLRAENAALRALVARFYTQAWEDPLTDDEMALLDPIVNDAVREQDRG